MEYIQTDTNGRNYIVNCCERCGKITEGIHTCTPNLVIERLQAEVERLKAENAKLCGSSLDYVAELRAQLDALSKQEPVGYMDGRGRFFYARDPHMIKNHEGMREVFTKPQTAEIVEYKNALRLRMAQITELRAELEQLRKAQGEPVGKVLIGGYEVELNQRLPEDTPLYTHPAPEQLTRQAALLKMAKEVLKKYHYAAIDAGFHNRAMLDEGLTAFTAIEAHENLIPIVDIYKVLQA